MSTCVPARTVTASGTATGAWAAAAGSRMTVASPCAVASALPVPSETVYLTVPSTPAWPLAVEPLTRSSCWLTTATSSDDPLSGLGSASVSSSTLFEGLVTDGKTSMVASALGRTKTVIGDALSCWLSAESTWMRTVPMTSVRSSRTV